jgi:hypothetical protein
MILGEREVHRVARAQLAYSRINGARKLVSK